ncbi:glycosyltransferase family 2 protein [Wenyingzhuangia sp. 1_MG-2023]|nr:glycosyltransferase family 2 protein [Wenyingzhuangia sp. 1_MG-2023]
MNKIAVLLTCFNRKVTTLRCLEHLFSFDVDFDVYLVDDGCTDGTEKAVWTSFPQVNIIKSKGDLFWNRGMHLAWKEAAKQNYDFYIWLNDDVVLYNHAFKEILECSELNQHQAIISGVIETHDQSRVIYGGHDQNKKVITHNGSMNSITFMNGNFVLIPKAVFNNIGNLDPKYHHDLGDVDYGLRAKKQNVPVVTTRVPIASGDTNSICRVRLNNTTMIKRFKRLYSPLGSNPNINFYHRKRHFGYLNAVVYYCFLVGLNVLPDTLNTCLFKNKYK